VAIGPGALEGLDVSPAFWKGRRVFVTGHTGFKGSWLSLWLQSLGARLTGYALASASSPSLFDTARVGEGMVSLIGDIRDSQALQHAIQAFRPEIVIHMAAQALVRESYRNPVETYAVNVMGSVNLLEAVRHTPGVKAVVNVTSDKCYENREWVWAYRETDAMGGYDPYSSSKGCAELVTAAYRNSFFNPDQYASHGVAIASARAGNVIGGGDWSSDRLIPDIMRAILEKRPAVIRCPGAIRPWQHVLEPLSGYLHLAQRLVEEGPRHAQAWNFGLDDGDTRPVAWIVDRLTQSWDDGATWVLDDKPHPHEAHSLKLDVAKTRAYLGWSARWSLERTLEQIVDWQKAFQAGRDMREFTLLQIQQYSETPTP
jgi:CDP-glucose 4,6-dehydratase